jgi:hypothetical protein
MSTQTKTLTVRLPLALHHASSEIAKRRQISLNALVQEGLSAIMKSEEYARLYEAFGQLGKDAEESDVEFATHAQWEVVSRGETQS